MVVQLNIHALQNTGWINFKSRSDCKDKPQRHMLGKSVMENVLRRYEEYDSAKLCQGSSCRLGNGWEGETECSRVENYRHYTSAHHSHLSLGNNC